MKIKGFLFLTMVLSLFAGFGSFAFARNITVEGEFSEFVQRYAFLTANEINDYNRQNVIEARAMVVFGPESQSFGIPGTYALDEYGNATPLPTFEELYPEDWDLDEISRHTFGHLIEKEVDQNTVEPTIDQIVNDVQVPVSNAGGTNGNSWWTNVPLSAYRELDAIYSSRAANCGVNTVNLSFIDSNTGATLGWRANAGVGQGIRLSTRSTDAARATSLVSTSNQPSGCTVGRANLRRIAM